MMFENIAKNQTSIWPFFCDILLSYWSNNREIRCYQKGCPSLGRHFKTQTKAFKTDKYLKKRAIYIKSQKKVMCICKFYYYIYIVYGKTANRCRGVFSDETISLGYITTNQRV
jgi:hypothetical protein